MKYTHLVTKSAYTGIENSLFGICVTKSLAIALVPIVPSDEIRPTPPSVTGYPSNVLLRKSH